MVIPRRAEVMNYFLWRQLDASANSLNMLASAHFPHDELIGKTTAEKHEMLHAKQINWAKQSPDFKRGRVAAREPGGGWAVDLEIPIFNRNPAYLEELVPAGGIVFQIADGERNDFPFDSADHGGRVFVRDGIAGNEMSDGAVAVFAIPESRSQGFGGDGSALDKSDARSENPADNRRENRVMGAAQNQRIDLRMRGEIVPDEHLGFRGIREPFFHQVHEKRTGLCPNSHAAGLEPPLISAARDGSASADDADAAGPGGANGCLNPGLITPQTGISKSACRSGSATAVAVLHATIMASAPRSARNAVISWAKPFTISGGFRP